MSYELGGPVLVSSAPQREHVFTTPTAQQQEPTPAQLIQAEAVHQQQSVNVIPVVQASQPDMPNPNTNGSRVSFQPDSQPSSSLAPPNGSSTVDTRSRSNSTMSGVSTDGTSITSAGDEDGPCVTDKRVKEWRKRFESGEDEELICTHGCALVIDIMIHGRIYMTQKNLNFRANIIGVVTKRTIPISSIVSISPRKVAGVISNAMEVIHTVPGSPKDKPSDDAGGNYKSLFTTLPKRDHTMGILTGVWRKEAPEAYEEFIRTGGGEDVRSRSMSVASRQQNGVVARDTEYEDSTPVGSSNASTAGDVGASDGAARKRAASTATNKSAGGAGPHPATKADAPDLDKQALNLRLQGEPEKVYELLYHNEEFLKGIWEGEGMFDIKMQDWQNRQRDFSYSRPLGGKVGSTRCENSEKQIHPEGNGDWWGVEGVTKTPGVPGGKAFHTQSKTVFTYAEGGGTLMHVTYQINWTSKSMLKGMINGQAESGQVAWNKLLGQKLKAYIREHPDEFPPSGNDGDFDDDDDDSVDVTAAPSGNASSGSTTANSPGSNVQARTSSGPKTDLPTNLDELTEWLADDPIRAAMAALLALFLLSYVYQFLARLITGPTVSIAKKRLKVLEAYEVAHLANLANEGKKVIVKGVKKAVVPK